MTDTGRRLLIAYAHPDDESFGSAGTIAHYVSQGVKVYLICATNGDVGTVDPKFMRDYRSISELRLAELDCAAHTLGLAEVFTFGYRDSGMRGSPDNQHPDSLETADLNEVTGRVVEVIRKVRPQVVVTFDPFGGYGHPDHIKIHRATVEAFHAAADLDHFPEQIAQGLDPYQPARLYFSTFRRGLIRLLVPILPLFGMDPARMGRNQDFNLYEFARMDSPIHARIETRPYQEIANRARLCHASQLGGLGGSSGLLDRVAGWFFGRDETFTRAYPPLDGRRAREHDLFMGVEPD